MKSVDLKWIDSFELWCYRRILRIPWTEKRSNAWVLDQLGVEKSLRTDIKTRKLPYFGHVTRHYCLEKIIIQGLVEGKRRRGSWLDNIKKLTGMKITEATNYAADRTWWRSFVQTTPAYVYAMWTREREESQISINKSLSFQSLESTLDCIKVACAILFWKVKSNMCNLILKG